MKEPVEDSDPSQLLDMDSEAKLHVLFGGTKVVQHTTPPKTTSTLRGTASNDVSRPVSLPWFLTMVVDWFCCSRAGFANQSELELIHCPVL